MTNSVCPIALFDNFVAASTYKAIIHSFNQICNVLQLDPLDHQEFYQKYGFLACFLVPNLAARMYIFYRLKTRLTPWKAKKLWALLDKRASQKDYKKQKACSDLNVRSFYFYSLTVFVILGGGGLRQITYCFVSVELLQMHLQIGTHPRLLATLLTLFIPIKLAWSPPSPDLQIFNHYLIFLAVRHVSFYNLYLPT